ncbi:uncharacterized protein LOC131248590 isoform X3 [Magnolia sinica]|uniref:uncharacterized protein LOC131248590 isoform X3 n=1 Tax=Magnolia sinica TaxID=86752 RepID=UPI002657E406|nr:uncharacterized protein LOC131248590 isoform X3 [Magnolia sinica]
MTGVTFQIANLVTKRCVSIPFPPNVRVNSVGPSLGLAYDGAASRKFKVQPVGRIVTMDVAREVVYDIATPRCDGWKGVTPKADRTLNPLGMILRVPLCLSKRTEFLLRVAISW